MKISKIDPAAMTANAINRELDNLRERDSILTRQMIDAGRGRKSTENYRQKADQMSSELNQISERRTALRIEIVMRYGPHPPLRLPAGRFFGPRKRTGVRSTSR